MLATRQDCKQHAEEHVLPDGANGLSNLRRLLQGALGGAGQTVIILCCSPAARNAQETLSTLRFGARAQGIVNTVQARSPPSILPRANVLPTATAYPKTSKVMSSERDLDVASRVIRRRSVFRAMRQRQ